MRKIYYFRIYMKHLFVLAIFSISFATHAMSQKVNMENAVDKAARRYGLRVEPQLKTFFAKANVSYPPKNIAILAFKSERKVELWAQNSAQKWMHIHDYPLTGFSGRLGPKLRENDRQIPEGVYKLVNFNPYSSMHLSMMINYPNSFDKEKGYSDGRKNLGNNIFIHGKNLSVGCLAVGDRAIDQLFILARRVGLNNIQIIIAPNDMRNNNKPSTSDATQPQWLPELYQKIEKSLKPFSHQHYTA